MTIKASKNNRVVSARCFSHASRFYEIDDPMLRQLSEDIILDIFKFIHDIYSSTETCGDVVQGADLGLLG